jgi:hypothetical protein
LYILTTDILLLTMTLTNDRPVISSERTHHKDKTLRIKLNLISGHELQMRIDAKTDRLTD